MRTATLLRDPSERLLSHYRFWLWMQQSHDAHGGPVEVGETTNDDGQRYKVDDWTAVTPAMVKNYLWHFGSFVINAQLRALAGAADLRDEARHRCLTWNATSAGARGGNRRTANSMVLHFPYGSWAKKPDATCPS